MGTHSSSRQCQCGSSVGHIGKQLCHDSFLRWRFLRWLSQRELWLDRLKPLTQVFKSLLNLRCLIGTRTTDMEMAITAFHKDPHPNNTATMAPLRRLVSAGLRLIAAPREESSSQRPACPRPLACWSTQTTWTAPGISLLMKAW